MALVTVAISGTSPDDPPAEARFTPPAAALLVALAGFLLGRVLARPLVTMAAALGAPRCALFALAMLGQWAPAIGACWVSARLWGRGRLRTDYDLHINVSDVRPALRASVAAWVVAVFVGTAFAALGLNSLQGDERVVGALSTDPASLVVLCVVVLVGAPLVEELFFRGLVQQTLTSVLGAGPAVVVQGLLFGLAHHSGIRDAGQFVAVLTLTAVGIILGVAAQRRRVTTSAIGHCFFNGLSMAARFL